MTQTRPKPNGARAAVIGAGSMGTLIAATLGRVIPVVMVCRNENRATQLFRWGASVEGLIAAHARPIVVRSIDEIPNAGGADLIFVATKTTAIPAVAKVLAPVLPSISNVGRRPVVVSFQNGIDPGRELMQRLNHDRVIRMVLSLGATLTEDGRAVRLTLNQTPHEIGSVDPQHSELCESIAGLLAEGGLETAFTPDIESAVWKKAIVNAAVNPVAALVNASVGDVIDGPSRIIMNRLLDEGVAVARSAGVQLPDDYVPRVLALIQSARDHIPSMVEDIRSGRESEIGQLNRQIMDRGRKLGVPVPTHETIDALIETFDWKVYHR
ncbi:MAG: 2-dehydropantoate 2-reductase [Phycisphaerales bacterium]